MWIGVVVVLVGGLYLTWGLIAGKIFVTLGTDLHKKTGLVERESNPTTFWIGWVSTACVLVVFAVFFLRMVLD